LYKPTAFSQIADELEKATVTAVRDSDISTPDLRAVLRFINKILQVAGQVTEAVYTILVDVQLLQPGDLKSDRILDIRRKLANLRVAAPFRDAGEIYRRLDHLSSDFDNTLYPIIERLPDRHAWQSVFFAGAANEMLIMGLINSGVDELESRLERGLSKKDLANLTGEAGRLSYDVRSALTRLEHLRTQMLGLSGEQGLIGLLSTEDRERVAATVANWSVKMSDTYNVQGAAAVGPGATAKDVTINQMWQTLENNDTERLANELDILRAKLKDCATDPEHDLAIGEVASAQIAAKGGDGPSAMKHLARAGTWALDTATTIGTTLAAAALKAAMGT
jgi:hypothetical protein